MPTRPARAHARPHTARRAARLRLAARVAATALSVSLAIAGTAAQAQDERTKTILLGDSITEGIGATFPFADLLSFALATTHEFANIGCGGTSTLHWTLSQGTDKCLGTQPATIFETFAIPELPADFLTIMLGTNDSVGFFLPAPLTAAEYRSHLEEIIGNSFFFGARTVVLMSPPPKCNPEPSVLLEEYRLEVIDICANHPDVLCGPDVYNLLDTTTDFDSCDVHPNQTGHGKIAQALGQSLVLHEPISPDSQVFQWFVPTQPPGAPALLPVVVYSDENFDAVASINEDTLTFGVTGWEDSRLVVPALGIDGCGPVDVDFDGQVDLVCAFVVDKTGLDLDSNEAWLRGRSSIGAAVDSQYIGPADELEVFPEELLPTL